MKLVWLHAILFVIVLADHVNAAAAPSPSEQPKVALIANRKEGLFWDLVWSGARASAKNNSLVIQTLGAGTAKEQVALLQDLIANGTQGIAISVIDPKSVDLAVASKAIIVTVDSDAAVGGSEGRVAFVGVDNYAAGRQAGEIVRKEVIPKGGKVAFFTGNLQSANAQARLQGATDGLLGRTPDSSRNDSLSKTAITEGAFTALPAYDAAGNIEGIPQNVQKAFQDQTDVAAVVALTDVEEYIDALQQAKQLGKVKVVAFDEPPSVLAGLKLGLINATVVQGAYDYGATSIQVLADKLRGKNITTEAGGLITIPTKVVKPDDVDAFVEDLEKKIGKSWGVEAAKKELLATMSNSTTNGSNGSPATAPPPSSAGIVSTAVALANSIVVVFALL